VCAQPIIDTEPKDGERTRLETKARMLINKAQALYQQGRLVPATTLFKQALAVQRQLFPREKFPNGHADLVASLNNVGALLKDRGELTQATPYFRDALVMSRKLFPKGHPLVAISLNNLGTLLNAQGELAQAEPFFRDALAMYRQLYPLDKYPQGHPQVAISLHNLGFLLQERGQLTEAEPFFQQAAAMFRKLYPPDKAINGHPVLATTLENLSLLRFARGQLDDAESYAREALAMRKRLYPRERFPKGHPELVLSLNDLGRLLHARGELAQAEASFRKAVAMSRAVYPREEFPNGHPYLALSLNSLGVLLASRGELADAALYFRDALGIRQQLFPRDMLRNGHPDLAESYGWVGFSLEAQGKLTEAEPYYRDALLMRQDLITAFADLAAESHTLIHFADLSAFRDFYLDLTARLRDADPERVYAVLWRGKGALARSLGRRQRLMRSLTDEDARRHLQELLEVRRRLAALVLAPHSGQEDGTRARHLQALSDLKEELEGKLARAIPALAREKARDRSTPADLGKALQAGNAFVDLCHYVTWDPSTRRKGTTHYAAFVVLPAQKVRRVELGKAGPIDKALTRWRQDIAGGLASDSGPILRRLVWDKLGLPGGTHTVYLCPDGALTAMPWAALPGTRKGTVLLDDCAIALVPHGHLLLEQDQATRTGAGTLLALGGVDYDQAAEPVKRRPEGVLAALPAERDVKAVWKKLGSTEKELDRVLALARELDRTRKVIELRGRAAGAQQLLAHLPQARVAHLATHAFFAAPGSEERKHLYVPGDFLTVGLGERVGIAARHPLTQTGLVLAGANCTAKAGDCGGILSAEALAGLPLDNLELAVLSACQTGLGEINAAEGVFGLQRAFHLAGTRTVVASLWKVDDEATAALMNVFYHQLWVEKQPPLQALRRAQLALRRHPAAVPVLARGRGTDFDKTVRRVGRPVGPGEARPVTMSPVRDWAAFVLSGAGR
jgi:CHAT domain-containing protein/tetratricopeptide (TPR) repeat protein